MTQVIPIKVFLSLLLLSCAVLAFVHRRRTRGVTPVIAVVAVIGIFFVWNPELTNSVAQHVGVGRGADLLLYLFVSISIGVSTVLYLRIVEIQEHVTILTREIAILTASRETASLTNSSAPLAKEVRSEAAIQQRACE